jgi:aspartate/methionine/tyrosine aminotransferase
MSDAVAIPNTMSVPAAQTTDRIALLKPTAVNAILAEVRALQAEGRKLISLMRGEPDFATPEHIVEAAARALRSGRTMYPDNRGEPKLREAVAKKLLNSASYDSGSEILITDGATLGVYAALMALLGPGDEVLVPDPIYDAYQSPIRLAGARSIRVKSLREQGRFAVTADALETAWTPRTKAVLLNTPWNPTGTVFTRAELTGIAAFVERHDLILISDEIYESITYDDHRHVSPVSLSQTVRDRCVMVNSFSKTYAMTGWRLGYCAAPKKIIDSMLLIIQQSSRGPATFVQDAGVAALGGPQDCVQRMGESYAERRRSVVEALSGLPKARVIPPEGGFFAMVDIEGSGLSSNEVRLRLLHEYGVVVVHGAAYGESGEGTLRVSFASGGENLSRGLELLRAGLASL